MVAWKKSGLQTSSLRAPRSRRQQAKCEVEMGGEWSSGMVTCLMGASLHAGRGEDWSGWQVSDHSDESVQETVSLEL